MDYILCIYSMMATFPFPKEDVTVWGGRGGAWGCGRGKARGGQEGGEIVRYAKRHINNLTFRQMVKQVLFVVVCLCAS